MCLYNYNNKIQTSNTITNEEYELLNKIYQCIASDDNENAKLLTSQLIDLQSSKESIDTLQDAINNLH
jgi:hypothetical protein